MSYLDNLIKKDLKEIAADLPDMIPYKDTKTMTGEFLLLSGLEGVDPSKIIPEDHYKVTYTNYKQVNHLRALKRLYRKGKDQEEKKAFVMEYLSKFQDPSKIK